jgi:hypothetical protein
MPLIFSPPWLYFIGFHKQTKTKNNFYVVHLSYQSYDAVEYLIIAETKVKFFMNEKDRGEKKKVKNVRFEVFMAVTQECNLLG